MSNQNQLDFLMNLITKHKMFLDQFKEPYVKFRKDDHYEVWPIKSAAYREFLGNELFNKYQFDMSDLNINKIISYAIRQARFSNEVHDLSVRLAFRDGAIYYDLCNSSWEVVKIDKTGFKILKKPPILFVRNEHQKEQPHPVSSDISKKLLRYVNISKEFQLLFLTTVISLFIANIAHPIIVCYGQKGSGKSTFSKIIKSLVDPSDLDIISFPASKDLPQVISKSYLTAFDNLSKIDDADSDILCRVCTGGTFIKRKLYSDNSEITYQLQRCILLNGIYQLGTKNDFLDRSFIFELEPISEDTRMTDDKFWDSFNKNKPLILGNFFNILSIALRIYETTKPDNLHRLADFDSWGYAIAEAIGGGQGEIFQSQYDRMISIQNEEAILSHPLANALISFMNDRAEWVGNVDIPARRSRLSGEG